MSYGGFPYGGVGYAGSDVADIPQADTETLLAVEWSPTTGPLETPVWVDITEHVRFWETQRGRNRELERFQPGRASIVLANRERQFDSLTNSNVRPMKRIRIRETFNGVTYPVFDGFVDKWQLDYPGMNKDATATVTATDAFKIFARTELPVSVYHDLILESSPDLYWRLDEVKNATEDATLTARNHGTLGTAGDAIYTGPPELGGEPLVVNDPGGSIGVVSDNSHPGTGDMGVTSSTFSLNPTVTTAWAAELWCIPRQDPGINGTLFAQRAAGGSVDIHAYYTASNTFVLNVFADGTDYSVNTSPTTYPTHSRYHLVFKVVPGQSPKLWVNGTLHDDADTMGPDYDELPGLFALGTLGASGGFNWDGAISHFSVWRGTAATLVDQAFVDAHYAAGTAPWSGDLPSERIDRVLDLVGYDARELDVGTATFQSAQISGQTVLEHAQKAGESEYAGLLFVTRDGKVRFVGRTAVFAREPYPIAFGDGAGEIGYTDFTPDDGDEVIRNRAKVSRLNGVVKTSEDTSSISAFGPFEFVLDGLLGDSESISQDYANFVVDEYGAMRRRITSLSVGPPITGDEDIVYPAILGPELGDTITVVNNPLGGGDEFSQVCVVEGIRASGIPGGIRETTFTLSPEFNFRALEDVEVATLGYASVSADQGSISSIVDLTGLSVTVTVGSNRRIRLTGHGQFACDGTAGTALGFFYESTTELGRWCVEQSAASGFVLGDGTCVLTPSAGSHTYKLRAQKFGGAGVLTLDGDATGGAFILVEDIGPV